MKTGCSRWPAHRNSTTRPIGRIDKTFPVPPFLGQLLALAAGHRLGGPLLRKRRCFESSEEPDAAPITKQDIITEYRRRVAGNEYAAERLAMLHRVLSDAGAVTYDELAREFRAVTQRAGLEGVATLKSLRHHFASALEVANISYFTRKYLMGHRVRRDPLAGYTATGFDQVRREFGRLLDGPMAPVVDAAHRRMGQLGLAVPA